MELPAELQARIDEVITQYPVSKRSAALPLLHLIQEHNGYIEDDAITWIAANRLLGQFSPSTARPHAGGSPLRIRAL